MIHQSVQSLVAILESQNRALEMTFHGATTESILAVLIEGVEKQSGDGALGSILLFDREKSCLRHGAAPHLPDAYNKAIDGIKIGPQVGSCGTAVFLAETITVSDIATDPLWVDYKDLALEHDLHACWSTPIISYQGTILGTFALYYRTVRNPTPRVRELVDLVTHTVALILEKNLESSKREEAERKLLVSKEQNLREVAIEQENFRALFRQVPEMVCILSGPEHRFSFVNKAHIKALGFDATGMTLLEAQPESIEIHGIIDNVYDTGVTAELREIPVTVGSSLRYFNLTYAARRDANGDIDGIVILGSEITEEVVLRKNMQASEERLALALQTSKVGFYDWDIPRDHVILSDRMLYDWGFPEEHELGKIQNALDRIHPADLAATTSLIEQSLKDHTPLRAEYRVIHPDGKIVWIDVRGQVTYDSEGNPLRFFGTSLNITARKQAIEELQAAKEAADVANETKSAFLANMSHEIRTPLGAILGFTDLLRNKEASEEEHDQFLDVISRNGNALSRIIDDILDLSKVEAGKLEFEFVDFNFSELLSEVVQMFSDRAKAKGVALDLIAPLSFPQSVVSDPVRLRQILVNIVGNAMKFTDQGSIQIKVETQDVQQDKTKLTILVKDTGAGMSEEQAQRLFQPFTQAENNTSRKFGGTGLGLALSRRLAKALGGDVTFRQYAMGVGCTVAVEVLVPKIKAVPAFPEQDIKENVTNNLPLKGIHLLVVDDVLDNRMLMTILLKKQGAIIDTASSGEEAIQKATTGKHDLVFMDIQMPGMDGFEAFAVLKKQGYKKPIVALTAHAFEDERIRVLKAGFGGHLTKPVDKELLIDMILSKTRHH